MFRPFPIFYWSKFWRCVYTHDKTSGKVSSLSKLSRRCPKKINVWNIALVDTMIMICSPKLKDQGNRFYPGLLLHWYRRSLLLRTVVYMIRNNDHILLKLIKLISSHYLHIPHSLWDKFVQENRSFCFGSYVVFVKFHYYETPASTDLDPPVLTIVNLLLTEGGKKQSLVNFRFIYQSKVTVAWDF